MKDPLKHIKGIKDAYKRYTEKEDSPLLRKLAAEVRQEEIRKAKKVLNHRAKNN